MQPVLQREVLEVAQPRIDLAQRLVGMHIARKSGFRCEPGALRGFDDEPRQTLAPAPIKTVGHRIFVHQALELQRRA
jgi:hypothetical protein